MSNPFRSSSSSSPSGGSTDGCLSVTDMDCIETLELREPCRDRVVSAGFEAEYCACFGTVCDRGDTGDASVVGWTDAAVDVGYCCCW